MTSPENHDEIVKFFEENDYFGAFKRNFFFFKQQMLPAVNLEGKILMECPSSIKLAPNGNGALFDAIKYRKDLQNEIKKLAYLQVIGVDNAIGKVLDPVFIGYTAENGFQAALKTVERVTENEPVGLVVQKNGVTEIIEYSELPDAIRKAREPSKEPAGWLWNPPPGPFTYR